MTCYALYCGYTRWVPAVITKVFGTCGVNVRVFPRGGTLEMSHLAAATAISCRLR